MIREDSEIKQDPVLNSVPSRCLLLLVDNNADDLFLFQRALRRAGVTHLTRSATDGKMALAMLAGLTSDEWVSKARRSRPEVAVSTSRTGCGLGATLLSRHALLVGRSRGAPGGMRACKRPSRFHW